MSGAYGSHLDNLPFQELHPVILVKDARFHHSMVVLHGETIFHQLSRHASSPSVLLLERLSISWPSMSLHNQPASPRSSLRSIPPGGLPSHSKADAPASFMPGARSHP